MVGEVNVTLKPDPHFEPREAICLSCLDDCMTAEVDFGWDAYIGSGVQHWGDWHERSACCQAEWTERTDAGDEQ